MQCVKCRGCGQLKLRYCFLTPHSSCTHDEAYSQSPSPMHSAGGVAMFRNLSLCKSKRVVRSTVFAFAACSVQSLRKLCAKIFELPQRKVLATDINSERRR